MNLVTNLCTSLRYGSSYLLEAVQSLCKEEKAAGSPHNELKMYLESSPEVTNDVIAWWGQLEWL